MTNQFTDEQIEAGAKAYWLASEREIHDKPITWEWDKEERRRYMWAARQVLAGVSPQAPSEACCSHPKCPGGSLCCCPELPQIEPRLRRLKSCVDAWPECAEGEYNPACCRFPKSCSATVYSAEFVTEDDLEPRAVVEAIGGEGQ